MGFYANMKLKTKLIAGFVIVSLFAAATGIVGLVSIRSICEINDTIAEVYIKAQAELTDINSTMRDMRVSLRNVALVDDQAMQDTQEQNLADQGNSLLGDVQTLASMIPASDTETSTIMNGYKESVDQYIAMTNGLVALLEDPGTKAQGIAQIFSDDVRALSDQMVKLADDLTARVSLVTEEAVANQQSIETQSNIILISTVAAAVVAGLLLGIILSGSTSKSVKKISDVVDKVAAGDFTVDVDMYNQSELGQLAGHINEMVANLRNVLSKVNDVSNVVDDTSRQVASSSMTLAQISTEQAGSSEEISAAMQNITTQTRSNSEYAEKASQLSEGTRVKAVTGNEHMNEMLKAMQAINDASANISNIIKVIDDIAFQTNILALNAAVEAARAGQHGKGFAVVAEEVRTLSARSATAASETTNMIEHSIKEVERGTIIAKETAASLKDILDGVADMAELIHSISSASKRQSDDATQISSGMDQISQAIQTTTSIAEETASSSSELSDQSTTLKDLVSAFRFADSETGAAPLAIGSRTARKKSAAPASKSVYDLPAAAGAENQSGGAKSGKALPSASVNSNDFGKY